MFGECVRDACMERARKKRRRRRAPRAKAQPTTYTQAQATPTHHELLDQVGRRLVNLDRGGAALLVVGDLVGQEMLAEHRPHQRVVGAAAEQVARAAKDEVGVANAERERLLAQHAVAVDDAHERGRLAPAHLVAHDRDRRASGLDEADLQVLRPQIYRHQAAGGRLRREEEERQQRQERRPP